MASVALKKWRTAGLSRLAELESVHAHITGSAAGRRWGTRQLNQSLFFALMAEFQAYCRDLHDEGVIVHVTHAMPGQRDLLAEMLTQGRKLQVGNPRRSVLEADFRRLDIRLVDELKKAGPRIPGHLDRLEALVDFRNAIGHGNQTKIAAIESAGLIQATKVSYDQHRLALDGLAISMDRVVSLKLAALLQIARPW
jgi:hypothetical protein